jgi:SNF2 family DNA or RNA helicase
MIADEMGLGKTVQALAVIKVINKYPVLVVCTSSLRKNWEREIKKWLPNVSVEVLYGTTPHAVSSQVLVVGYDVFYAWGRALPTVNVLVFDESHLLKNGNARRTQEAIRYSDKVHKAGGSVLCLTGTPVLNRPTELLTQLRIMNRLGEFGGVQGFKEQFRDPKNLVTLNKRLRSTCFVRRRKSDVLQELPPKRWADVVVDGDPTVMAEYRKAERDIVGFLKKRTEELAAASGASTAEAKRAAWEQALRAEAAQHLVAVNTLKLLAARAKLSVAEQWITEFVGTGSKLVVFGWHREIVGGIAERFGQSSRVQGGMSDEEKQSAVDSFQTDADVKVISCSLKAAGVGITLTAASDVLFLEQGWTPADQDQAADRCHRIGQQDSVTAWTFICQDTIDEYIADVITAKRAVVDAATDGERNKMEHTTSVLGDVLVWLANKA